MNHVGTASCEHMEQQTCMLALAVIFLLGDDAVSYVSIESAAQVQAQWRTDTGLSKVQRDLATCCLH